MKVGIVCGYGIKLDDNLITYLEAVINYSKENQISKLICSGGYTSKNSDMSEARLMFKFIKKQNEKIDFLLEEESITTLHNLLYSKKLIEDVGIPFEKLYIFCDNVRFAKIYLLSKIIFRGQLVEVKKMGREESISWYFIQIPAICFQILGAIFPTIEKKLLLEKENWLNKQREL
jgi:hypothetical protein